MISEGEDAPAVSLPAYVDGERRRIDLDANLGEGIVVLAFYPADFDPACTMRDSDLGDLDLFTMQKDVSVFAVSPDSTYSHEAFAERYGLHVPLLSDGDGDAAAAYDVATETEHGETLVERAVFVVDHRGEIQYAWATDDLETEFDVGPVKRAVGDIGGDDTALERYRAGRDDYVAGRESFVEARSAYEEREWMDARNGFEAAEPAFATAADHFDTAVRFAETADFETVVDRAEEKADTLRHAADWLADSADALASGRGKQGRGFRDDAQRLLDAAADLPDPPDAAAMTTTDDGIDLADSVAIDPEAEGENGYARQADDGAGVDTDLGLDDADLDAAVADDGDGSGEGSRYDESASATADDPAADGPADGHEGSSIEGDTVEGDLEMDLGAIEAAGEDGSNDVDGETDADDGRPDDDARPDGDPHAANEGSPAIESPVGDPEPTDAQGSPDDPSSPDEPASPETAGEHSDAGAAPGSGTDSSAPLMRGGSADTTDGASPRSEGERGGDGDDGDVAAVEELDLADPTEGDDEEDAEQRDWDIPGQ